MNRKPPSKPEPGTAIVCCTSYSGSTASLYEAFPPISGLELVLTTSPSSRLKGSAFFSSRTAPPYVSLLPPRCATNQLPEGPAERLAFARTIDSSDAFPLAGGVFYRGSAASGPSSGAETFHDDGRRGARELMGIASRQQIAGGAGRD